MALTDTAVRTSKPKDKPFKLADGQGMYLLVNPTGGRYWRLKYRFAGKEKTLALGVYPQVSLAEARRRREKARELLARGTDPSVAKREAKRSARAAHANSFEKVAREWISKQAARWSRGHTDKVLSSLQADIFPYIGTRPIAKIAAPELLDVLRRVEQRGVFETLSKLYQRCGAIFRYGIATGRCTHDPAADLRGAFTTPKAKSHAALSVDDLPEFLHKLDTFEDAGPQTQLALRLMILTFVRTDELRAARWDEFKLAGSAPTWCIPAERMKMSAEHIVPLSRQAAAVMQRLRPLSSGSELVFPGRKNLRQPISKNTLLYAMYRMGYHGRATVHGFRATASTILNEQGYRADVIERQLAHAERNKVRAAYNRAEYLIERRQMMQSWADLLDGMARGANVVPLRTG